MRLSDACPYADEVKTNGAASAGVVLESLDLEADTITLRNKGAGVASLKGWKLVSKTGDQVRRRVCVAGCFWPNAVALVVTLMMMILTALQPGVHVRRLRDDRSGRHLHRVVRQGRRHQGCGSRRGQRVLDAQVRVTVRMQCSPASQHTVALHCGCQRTPFVVPTYGWTRCTPQVHLEQPRRLCWPREPCRH